MLTGFQQSEQFKHIMDQIKKEDNLGAGQEQEIIWLLWQRKDELTNRLSEWEVGLSELKVNHGNIKEGLQVTA